MKKIKEFELKTGMKICDTQNGSGEFECVSLTKEKIGLKPLKLDDCPYFLEEGIAYFASEPNDDWYLIEE